MSDKIIRFDDAMFGLAVIERCRRRESGVEEALMEMCLAGVGTRGVDDTGRLLWGERMPSRTLSDKLKKIHKGIDEWRKRPLESEYPYVFVDGVRHKRSRGGHVENAGVLVAIGVGTEGRREAIAVDEGMREDAAGRERFFRSMVERGSRGVGETTVCLLPGFPANHGIKPRTNDMIERLNREIRRRTRVVGGFPDSDSALMLVCAGIRYVTSRSWSDRRYMDMSRLDDNPGAAA